MRRATVGVGTKESPFFSSARTHTGGTSRSRNGGLFSSSSSSSGDSDASNEGNDDSQMERVIPSLMKATARSRSANLHSNSLSATDLKRRSMFSTATTSLSASVGVERKGLFETDDDAGDSLEAFHEQVKLRQSKKQSELKTLRAQLETAKQRAEELETRLCEVNKQKEEFAIRTNECQRIIEKRNKQLLKASEKLARQSEQYDLQTAELQSKLAAVSTQCTQLRADAATIEQSTIRERTLKERERQKDLETLRKKHEKALQAAEARLGEQQAENAVLVKKLREVEQELASAANQTPTPGQIMATEEFQSLLKRYEDTEAIVRGLKYQLEKEQHEKNYLQKQLTALQEIKGAKTKDDAEYPKDSPARVVADDELASFDLSADEEPTLNSPKATKAVGAVVTESLTSRGSSSSPSRRRSRGLSASSFIDESPKPTIREGKRRATSVQMSKATVLELPDRSADEKALVNNNKAMATTSVTFFGKLSSKFKRASSPRNGLQAYSDSLKGENESADRAMSSEVGVASPGSSRQGYAPSKVLKERPRMYVAKPPSFDDAESSDSIFGSESSSSASSDDMPPPPPPPPIVVHEVSFTPSVQVNMPSQLDSRADAAVSCSSHDVEERRNGTDKRAPLATKAAEHKENDNLGALQMPSGTSLPSSSSSSSSSSDDDSSESDVETTQARHVDTKMTESLVESSSSPSSSSGDENEESVNDLSLKPDRKSSLSGQDQIRKRSSHSPPPSKSRTNARSVGSADTLHRTSKTRMNEYMEARARKRNEKIKRTQQKEYEETIKKEEYEKEWEKMAQEERERKRKQQQARRNGRRRPASMKAVRVSQMRQQLNNKQQQREQKDTSVPSWPPHGNDPPRPYAGENVDGESRPSRRKSEAKTSGSEAEEERLPNADIQSPPLPPEPAMADNELYLRQQARLRERHEMQLKKKIDADTADAVRGEIHRRVEMWAFGKELLHLILTLDQISSNDALKKCQLMVVQSPDDDTVRKAYRNIIRVVHPDKLRGATIPEQLEAKELFTVLNQAFEKFKAQAS